MFLIITQGNHFMKLNKYVSTFYLLTCKNQLVNSVATQFGTY